MLGADVFAIHWNTYRKNSLKDLFLVFLLIWWCKQQRLQVLWS